MRRLLIILLLWSGIGSRAQNGAESLLREAKSYAEQTDYRHALEILQTASQQFPTNEDLLVYKGRVLAWDKQYAAATNVLSPLADRQLPNKEAIEVLATVYFWWQKYSESLGYCDKILATDPNNTDLLWLKAQNLEQLGRDDEALAILDQSQTSGKPLPGAETLRSVISRKSKNAVSVSYLNVSTANPGSAPLHYGYLEYTRKLRTTTILGRAGIGVAHNDTQGQFETDVYHTFRRKDYLYLNVGVSTGKVIFPVFRAGAEYYFKPKKQLEYSAGLRFLHFDSEDVTLATGHIGYNFGAYNVGYRPFYDTQNSLFSHVLSLQKTNEAKERLIRLELQYGNVPYLYLYNGDATRLNAYRVGLQYQWRVGAGFLARPVLLYEYEEYIPDNFRHRFNLQFIATKRF